MWNLRQEGTRPPGMSGRVFMLPVARGYIRTFQWIFPKNTCRFFTLTLEINFASKFVVEHGRGRPGRKNYHLEAWTSPYSADWPCSAGRMSSRSPVILFLAPRPSRS